MNVLVTNTRAAQAYFVIRSLRPHAAKIVATMYGKNLAAAYLSHAAQSRLVDARYHVPTPAQDWKRGKIATRNTAQEEAYVKEILRICEREEIDTIFPSWDAQMYVFSKNKERFEKLGVLIPVPDFEVYRRLLDKYQIVLLAQRAGLPCPKTYLPRSLNDLTWIASEVGFPIAIKPRFASWGTAIATDGRSLLAKVRDLMKSYGMPMIQEFIPVERRDDLHFILDKQGELKLAYWRSTHRTLHLDPHGHFSTVHELADSAVGQRRALDMACRLGWWGSGIIETVIDARDGEAKFVEFIPRFRRQLWNTAALGINEPWICIQIARNQPVAQIENCPVGTVFLSPVEDICVLLFQLVDLLVYRIKKRSKLHPVDVCGSRQSMKQLLRSFIRTYASRKPKFVDPYFKNFFRDPLVSLLWWLQLSTWMMRLARQLGR